MDVTIGDCIKIPELCHFEECTTGRSPKKQVVISKEARLRNPLATYLLLRGSLIIPLRYISFEMTVLAISGFLPLSKSKYKLV